jgi:hypothetical protein
LIAACGLLDATLCDKICQWFSIGMLLSSTNKTDYHEITSHNYTEKITMK